LQGRIEKNRALLVHIRSSLNAYRPGSGHATGQEGMSKRDQVLEAISSIKKDQFTGEDIVTETTRLFPDVQIDRALVSSILWKTISSGKAKTFRQIYKGVGRKPSLYEKISGGVRVRSRQVTDSPDLLPHNIEHGD
jgi:hypothetical protein